MRVNRDVRVRSDPLSLSFLFFILSALSTLRKLLHTLHSRMSEIQGSYGWASRMDCSGHCKHREWHQVWCSTYRDCTCKLVQATGFRTLVFLKAGLLEPFSTYETICHIATQFSRCSWNVSTYDLSLSLAFSTSWMIVFFPVLTNQIFEIVVHFVQSHAKTLTPANYI